MILDCIYGLYAQSTYGSPNGVIIMNKEQEMIVTARIRQEMTKVRNDAIATGMRSALAVVLDYCNKDISAEDKVAEIREFCEKGLNKKD